MKTVLLRNESPISSPAAKYFARALNLCFDFRFMVEGPFGGSPIPSIPKLGLPTGAQPDLIIRFEGNHFLMGEGNLNFEEELSEKVRAAAQGIWDSQIQDDRFACVAGELIVLDFLVASAESVLPVGGISLSESSGRVLRVFQTDQLRTLPTMSEQKLPDGLVSLTIVGRKTSNSTNPSLDIRVNQVGQHWEIYRASTVNIPLLLIFLAFGYEVVVQPTINPAHVLTGRFPTVLDYGFTFDRLYVDLDDTLIFKKEKIPTSMNFVLGLRNSGRQIHLITRHEDNVFDTMETAQIPKDTFDEVINVKPWELKSSFVTGSAIFLDNEFHQRLDVWNNCRVPAIDLGQIEFFNRRFGVKIEKPFRYF